MGPARPPPVRGFTKKPCLVWAVEPASGAATDGGIAAGVRRGAAAAAAGDGPRRRPRRP